MKRIIAILLALMLLAGTVTALADADRETVKQVQQALNDAGFDCGTPDGAAGKKTKAAIIDYQAANGLSQTGEIDDALLAAMGLAGADGDGAEAVDGEAVDGVGEITFQGVPWDTRCEDLGKALMDAGFLLVDEGGLYAYVFGTVKDSAGGGFMLRPDDALVLAPLDAGEYSGAISNIAFGTTTSSDGRSTWAKIAGYDMQDLMINFVCADGTARPVLYQVTLAGADKAAMYQDLLAKLTRVYGECAHGESHGETTDVWLGANDTAVVLRADKSGDGDQAVINDVKLCYGRSDAEALAAAALGQAAPNNGVDAGDTSGL